MSTKKKYTHKKPFVAPKSQDTSSDSVPSTQPPVPAEPVPSAVKPAAGLDPLVEALAQAEMHKKHRQDVESRYADMLSDAENRIKDLECQLRQSEASCESYLARLDASDGEDPEGKEAFLEVSSLRDRGFYRCGRKFTKKCQLLRVADLGEKEADRLMTEAMLSVRRVMR